MDTSIFMGQIGYALPLLLGGIGSAIGIMNAGRAAAGEWAKEGKVGLKQKFVYIILTSMPLSQTIYGFAFMQSKFAGLLNPENVELFAQYGVAIFSLALACGILQMASAWAQGLLGAAGCRTLSDSNGKGFTYIIVIMGVVETVGLFGFALLLSFMPTL